MDAQAGYARGVVDVCKDVREGEQAGDIRGEQAGVDPLFGADTGALGEVEVAGAADCLGNADAVGIVGVGEVGAVGQGTAFEYAAAEPSEGRVPIREGIARGVIGRNRAAARSRAYGGEAGHVRQAVERVICISICQLINYAHISIML